MPDVAGFFERFAHTVVTIETAGPPQYDCERVTVRSDADGFRLLAAVLLAMADSVSSAEHPAHRDGWHLVLNPSDVPQLRMPNGVLALDCEPKAQTAPT